MIFAGRYPSIQDRRQGPLEPKRMCIATEHRLALNQNEPSKLLTAFSRSERGLGNGALHSTAIRLAVLLLSLGFQTVIHAAENKNAAQAGKVLTVEGIVEISRLGRLEWAAASSNLDLSFGDRLRTGPQSRATVRLSDRSVLRVNERTVLQIRPQSNGNGLLLDLQEGSTYFFNRSKPGTWQFHTPLVSGAIRGTEFNLASEPGGRTTVALLDGEVVLNNQYGEVVLHSGDLGTIDPNRAPQKTAVLHAVNIIQWSLYYPAVLDLSELGLREGAPRELTNSIEAYLSGDLLGALAKYPSGFLPELDAQRIYHAALLLSVGQVEQTEAELNALRTPSSFSAALRELIAAVKHEEFHGPEPETASGWLAHSYYLQAASKIREAHQAARVAVEKSPEFGYAWVRLAELEFSLGRGPRATEALERGLNLCPRNAQALALKGFLLASANRTREAAVWFGKAITADGALANAWLGLGLCEIRQGYNEAGRQDLQVAAALEPNRSDLRSYLGKAWVETHHRVEADKELRLAKRLDPKDPTPWLYSALVKEAYNQQNEAIGELERSKALNNNRSVYRSSFLLDQDQAVRSANLARMYQDAGMFDVSVQEATRSVDLDYGNYSAHLFLADSYDSLRDPRKVNLRYETPWFSQLLVADLLAPVGGLPLSQNVSQQEYSRLFAGDRLGFYSDTGYLSRGAWLENASEFGNVGNSAFALDQYYLSDRGERPNNDVRDANYSLRLKQQITPQDSVFFEANASSDYSSGDVLQYYDPAAASHTVRITETQEPNLFAGYHHEWGPGIHTLLLVGRLQDTFTQTDPDAMVFITTKNAVTGQIVGVSQRPANLAYESDLTAYSTELQQIFQGSSHTLVFGARYQTGDIDTDSFVQRLVPVGQTNSLSLNRISGYGYYSWQVIDPLQLTAGLTYDYLEYPQNNEIPPVSSADTHTTQLSPKAGIRWTPLEDTTLRGVYTRSLGGVFYDTSVRLEPTEVAGFNQAFRSIIPESVAGLVPGSRFETFGVALDQRFQTRTYLSVSAELLKSHGSRTVGTLDAYGPLLLDIPSGVGQILDYQEKTLTVALNQLLGKEIALGARYLLSRASLDDDVQDISPGLSGNFSVSANRDVSAVLQQLDLYTIYNHPSGFFAKAESIWSAQSNEGYAISLPGDDFWQFNVFAGYRFARRMAQVQVGLLNIGNQDYKLNPLNLYSDLPRSRTLFVGLKVNF